MSSAQARQIKREAHIQRGECRDCGKPREPKRAGRIMCARCASLHSGREYSRYHRQATS
jgi:hypothetical protein